MGVALVMEYFKYVQSLSPVVVSSEAWTCTGHERLMVAQMVLNSFFCFFGFAPGAWACGGVVV